jgi:hypothetical protein
MLFALTPEVESWNPHPSRDGVIVQPGLVLTSDQISKVSKLWSKARHEIVLAPETWQYLRSFLLDWIYPIYASPQIAELMRAFTREVIQDLASHDIGHPVLISELARLAESIGLDLELETDPLFELLFPADPSSKEEHQYLHRETRRSLGNLASSWVSERTPYECAGNLVFLTMEASYTGASLRWTYELCRFLADRAESPDEWLIELIDQQLPAEMVEPFLERVATLRTEGWEESFNRCLDNPSLVEMVSSLVLSLREPPASLLERVLGNIEERPDLIELLCMRSLVPVSTLQKLLRHRSWLPAVAAAVGEMVADPHGEVREELLEDWRSAVMRYMETIEDTISVPADLDYWVGEIISHESDLALAWLSQHLEAETPYIRDGRGEVVSKAIAALDSQQRTLLLEPLCRMSRVAIRLLPKLVDRDATLYRHLLDLPQSKLTHLLPLQFAPDQQWIELARVALGSDYTPKDVAAASFLGIPTYGNEEEHWRKWERGFATFEEHEDERLLEVARHGLEMSRQLIEEAQAENRQEERNGRS